MVGEYYIINPADSQSWQPLSKHHLWLHCGIQTLCVLDNQLWSLFLKQLSYSGECAAVFGLRAGLQAAGEINFSKPQAHQPRIKLLPQKVAHTSAPRPQMVWSNIHTLCGWWITPFVDLPYVNDKSRDSPSPGLFVVTSIKTLYK